MNVETIKTLLQYIGEDTAEDKALAMSCLVILEKEQEADKSKAETKKKAAKKKEFDMGKLGALIDGGWSVEKIADEMGVSQQTIYNKMKLLEAN